MIKAKKGVRIAFEIALLIFCLAVISCIVSLAVSRYSLKVTRLSYSSDKVTNEFSVVQITDLHGITFGENNCRLIETVKNLNPDAVFMTGDIISPDGEIGVAKSLVESLCEDFDVYFSVGNHELEFLDECTERIGNAGATILEKEYCDITLCENDVRIGGTSGFALGVDFWAATYGKNPFEYYETEDFSEQRFMLDYSETDNLKILLLHHPEAPTLWSKMGWYDVDIVLSGHTHGGVVRFPFVGGLFAPEEGFFPDYEYGLFEMNGVTTYISSGLSGAESVPRFNNVPEVVYLTVSPENAE